MTYRLDYEESLNYIDARLGHKKEEHNDKHVYSLSAYKARKKKLQSDESLNTWLNNHAAIGFVQEHKQAIKDVENLIKETQQMYLLEINTEKDHKKIIDLSYLIVHLIESKTALNMGNPIIAKIKKEVDIALEATAKFHQVSETIDNKKKHAIFN